MQPARFSENGSWHVGRLFLGGPTALESARASTATTTHLLGFKGIVASIDDALRLPPGYRARVFAPWGTPLLDKAPPWKPDASDDAAAQATQVGDNHDDTIYEFGQELCEDFDSLTFRDHALQG